jgi:small subunit ribosomal protein S4
MKKQRKTYEGPSHPWRAKRIEEERVLVRDYGIGTKTELWKQASLLSRFKRKAKQLATLSGGQADIEKKQLFERIGKYGLLKGGAQELGNILGLNIRDILERRLQTIVYKKKLARSPKQARQFIVHRHIRIGDKAITSPSYLVKLSEEPLVKFSETSTLADELHPERVIAKTENTKIIKPEEKKKAE